MLVRKQRKAKRLKGYELVQYLRAKGLSTRRVAKILGLSRGTVIRYAQAKQFPDAQRRPRSSILDPYLPYMEKRVQEGYDNSQQLWRKITAKGYPGSMSQVSEWMTWRRRQTKDNLNRKREGISPLTLPSVKELTRLLVRRAEHLDDADKWHLEHLKKLPVLEELHELIHAYFQMICKRIPEALDPWLSRCRSLGVKTFGRFADGLMQDYAAVRAALETQWSNEQTEGQVNRLKMLKRQMYGRAKVNLLRKRMLYQP